MSYFTSLVRSIVVGASSVSSSSSSSLSAALLGGLPYTVTGDALETSSSSPSSLWTMYPAQRKADHSPVTVFVAHLQGMAAENVALARNAMRRMKTLRHPNLLQYIDGSESDAILVIVTEAVTRFGQQDGGGETEPNEQMRALGLFELLKGIKFINEDANVVHGAVCVNSIYVTLSGEWKLGGFEFVDNLNESTTMWPSYSPLKKYWPPELLKGSISTLKSNPTWALDMWYFGTLIYEVYNGPFKSIEEIKSKGRIPESLFPTYKEILKGDPKARPVPSTLIEKLSIRGSFFANDLIYVNQFLENFALKEQYEKDQFFRKLVDWIDGFPDSFCMYKILPELAKALEFGNAGSRAMMSFLKIGAKFSKEEYEEKVISLVVKMFASPDRSMRLSLLESLPSFIDHLSPKIVNEKIFVHVATGFVDASPVVREQTIKSMILFAPKLNDKTMNNEVLRFFAKLQMDEEPGIRTNTTICLGRISEYLSDATKKKVLIPAFSRAIKDPFPPARKSAVMGFGATNSYYAAEDIAGKIIPILSNCLIDSDRAVRTEAFKAVYTFVKNLEKHSEEMKDAAGEQSPLPSGSAASKPSQDSTVDDSTWSGWVSKKLTTNRSATAASPSSASSSASSADGKGASAIASSPSPATAATVQSETPKRGMVLKGKATVVADGWDTEQFDDILEDADAEDVAVPRKQPQLSPPSRGATKSAAAPAKAAADGWGAMIDIDDNDAEEWGSLEDASTTTPAKSATTSTASREEQRQQQQQRREQRMERQQRMREQRETGGSVSRRTGGTPRSGFGMAGAGNTPTQKAD